MTKRQDIEKILSPAIDVKAPYAKVIVDMLLKSYLNTTSERDALVAALTKFAEAWPYHAEETKEVKAVLRKLKAGEYKAQR